MKITILAALLVFLAYFLLLYGAVGFIQDKRFFASARLTERLFHISAVLLAVRFKGSLV